MDRTRYPRNWKEISLRVRQAALWMCEWCHAQQGKPHPATGSKVVLTVAHVGPNKHDKMDCSNLVALCQRCHLAEDAEEHAENAKRTRAKKRLEAARKIGQQAMFEEGKE